jgi:hypothetical protein
MEFKVGSIEEIDFIENLIQKQSYEKDIKEIGNDRDILAINEYKYLKYLVFKYCLIPNPSL